MKVGIFVGDLNPLKGGESSLTKTILLEIKKHSDPDLEYVFLYYSRSCGSEYMFMNEYKFINISKCCSIGRLVLNGLVESLGGASGRFFALDKIASKEGIDVFYFAAPIYAQTSLPYIFTVWDLGHRTTPYFPEMSSDDWGYREKMYSHMLPRATYIITANECGKKDILKYYNVDEDRIKTVPFPVTSLCRCMEKKPDFYRDSDCFFYPAQFWPHKNHIVILEALKILKEESGLKPVVYFTGSDKGNKKYLEEMISRYGLDDLVVFTGFIEDGEVKYLYKHSKALVFASLLGPNNLPPIEAKYLGCPIILSDIPGHREQMGDDATYFDGYDAHDLAEKMKQALSVQYTERVESTSEDDSVYFEKVRGLLINIRDLISRWKYVKEQ